MLSGTDDSRSDIFFCRFFSLCSDASTSLSTSASPPASASPRPRFFTADGGAGDLDLERDGDPPTSRRADNALFDAFADFSSSSESLSSESLSYAPRPKGSTCEHINSVSHTDALIEHIESHRHCLVRSLPRPRTNARPRRTLIDRTGVQSTMSWQSAMAGQMLGRRSALRLALLHRNS